MKNKNILITGASSGLGKAIAIYFSKKGARLILSGRDHTRLKKTHSLLTGTDHLIISADVSNVQDVKNLMESANNQVGMLDVVVHCAGIQKTIPLQVINESHFDQVFDTNVKSSQFLAKNFRRKGFFNPNGSSLIFISSVAAFCGEPAVSTYAASKAALIGLSKSLAIELSRCNIRVNCIAPGHVETEMNEEFSKQLTKEQKSKISEKHPLGLGIPENIAHAAAFLASDKSSWITGTTLVVDGGYSAH
ncbi:SDR family NAD(P)-dependent oxidoreductase [Shewanella sp. 10N.286.51.B8]|uniref:SDR family NAD(P)-dependent oxidoreductase n=1 Tax=Shewanella sp. 10N.286.51.B8 TaxID=3229708 RepID=UPI00355291ED